MVRDTTKAERKAAVLALEEKWLTSFERARVRKGKKIKKAASKHDPKNLSPQTRIRFVQGGKVSPK